MNCLLFELSESGCNSNRGLTQVHNFESLVLGPGWLHKHGLQPSKLKVTIPTPTSRAQDLLDLGWATKDLTSAVRTLYEAQVIPK
jgi:hypothetical protein